MAGKIRRLDIPSGCFLKTMLENRIKEASLYEYNSLFDQIILKEATLREIIGLLKNTVSNLFSTQ